MLGTKQRLDQTTLNDVFIEHLSLTRAEMSSNFSVERSFMPSRRMRTKIQRKTRKARKGKERKRQARNKGTTPKFSVHLN